MAIRLDIRSGDFAQKFRAFLDTKREAAADVEARSAPSSPTSPPAAIARSTSYTQKFDRLDLDRVGAPSDARTRSRRRVTACTPRDARCARTRPRPHRGLSPPASAAGRSLHRRARRRTRLALDRDRSGRALCAGRHRGLSVVGADERGAGQGRRRAAHRDGGAGAGRRTQSAGAGGGETRRRRRDLSASAARRRSRRWPMAPRPSRRSPRSSGPATPMWRPPSAWCSARSAST